MRIPIECPCAHGSQIGLGLNPNSSRSLICAFSSSTWTFSIVNRAEVKIKECQVYPGLPTALQPQPHLEDGSAYRQNRPTLMDSNSLNRSIRYKTSLSNLAEFRYPGWPLYPPPVIRTVIQPVLHPRGRGSRGGFRRGQAWLDALSSGKYAGRTCLKTASTAGQSNMLYWNHTSYQEYAGTLAK